MDPALVSAMSAVLGSLVGGSATVATAWLTQRSQRDRELMLGEIRKREVLYGEFIRECSKLAIDSLDHQLDDVNKAFTVYSLQNQIRLNASEEVVAASEQTITSILSRYLEPNLSKDEMRIFAMERPNDPVKVFSLACRNELRRLLRVT